jgi:hypothetical protein
VKDGKVPASATKKRQPPGGSRKGKPNKVTAELKDMIRQALDKAGGVNYLTRQANENPAAFMSLVGKTLPKEVTADIAGRLDIALSSIELVPLSAKPQG